MIQLRRVYDRRRRSDGARFLVDRLWPRGVRKADVSMDGWAKDVSPSTELRKWFSHDPAKWPEFQNRYFRELGEHPSAWKHLLNAAQRGTVTLLYSSHDKEHNNAAALKSFLDAKLAHESLRSNPR